MSGPDSHNDAGVRLTVVSSEAEAAILRALLLDEGIPSQVTGETVGSTLNYYGGAVCRVEVLVHASKLEQARQLLKQYEARRSQHPASDWICGRCQEVNAGSFEACWSCQKLRDEADQVHIESDPWIAGSSTGDSASREAAFSESESGNPYAPPRIADRSAPTISPNAEDLVRRLKRGAIFGLVISPVAIVMLFVAMKTMSQLATGQLIVSRHQQRQIQLYSLMLLVETLALPLLIFLL